eukprot:3106252-Alexandrium_andersonii.AAC.1
MNQTISGIARSYLIAIEDAYGVDVRAQDRLRVWAVRRASWTHSRTTPRRARGIVGSWCRSAAPCSTASSGARSWSGVGPMP